MTDQRHALHAYLSEAAHDAWQTFAEENGVSLTGLLEALGLEIDQEMKEAGGTGIRGTWVKAARRIDADRRKRTRRYG